MPRKTVLIADDDRALLEALTLRLNAEGIDVITTMDAYQALATARKEKPDLLLLDINMPAGNGFSVHERVSEIPEIAQTPIIYITGEDPDSVDHTAAQLGAIAVIHKPFETAHLIESVHAALGKWISID